MTRETADSKLHFKCSKCQTNYSALPEQAGKKGKCNNCGAPIKVPKADSVSYVYLALNWIFGISFVFAGLISLVESPLAGLSLVVIALLLLPPVRDFAYSKTNKAIPVKTRAVFIFVLFIASGVFVWQSQDKKAQELATQQAKEKAEKAAQLRQQNIDYFDANREQIISSVKASLSAKKYQSAITQSAKYLISSDEKLNQMYSLATTRLAEMQKGKTTEKLLAELKTVPTEKYEKNKNLYQQLVNLQPDNKRYKNKVGFYSQKIKEAKQKQLAGDSPKTEIKKSRKQHPDIGKRFETKQVYPIYIDRTIAEQSLNMKVRRKPGWQREVQEGIRAGKYTSMDWRVRFIVVERDYDKPVTFWKIKIITGKHAGRTVWIYLPVKNFDKYFKPATGNG